MTAQQAGPVGARAARAAGSLPEADILAQPARPRDCFDRRRKSMTAFKPAVA